MIDVQALTTASAIFSEDGLYRVWLRRAPPAGLFDTPRRILWGLCNPSIAGSLREDGTERSDKTISTCVGFGERLGATEHGFLNLLGRIGTDPDSLYGVDDPDGPDNGPAWEAGFEWLTEHPGPILMFAWGGKLWSDRQPGGRELLNARSRSIARAFRLADQHKVTPKALGLTMAGSPRHPSRLGYDTINGIVELNGKWRRKHL